MHFISEAAERRKLCGLKPGVGSHGSIEYLI
jgi:hypothetical protein